MLDLYVCHLSGMAGDETIQKSHLLLCPELITIVTVFLWIKGYANFQPTTPVHKKRAVTRHV